MKTILASLLLSSSLLGCASTNTPCQPPELVFDKFVEGGRGVVGKCHLYKTFDTGDVVVVCRVDTEDHGIVHKRMMNRSCWRR